MKLYNQAIRDLDKSAALNPKDSGPHFQKGCIFLDQGKWKQALACFDNVERLDPSSKWIDEAHGRIHYGMKQYAKAEHDYRAALKQNPQRVYLAVELGRALGMQNKYWQAIGYFNQAITRANGSNLAWAYDGRAKCWVRLEKDDKALRDCNRAISILPNEPTLYYKRAVIKNRLERYRAAITDYTRAISLDHKCAQAYNGRGVAWRGLENYKRALADHAVAIHIEPTKSAYYYFSRGRTLRRMKRYIQAIHDLDKSIALDPDDYRPYYEKSSVFMNQKKWKNALPWLSKAQKKSKGVPSIRAALIDNQAWCYYQMKEPTKSALLWSEILKGTYDGETKTGAYAFRGFIRMRQGRKAEAHEDFLQVRKYLRREYPKDRGKHWKYFQKMIMEERKRGPFPSKTR